MRRCALVIGLLLASSRAFAAPIAASDVANLSGSDRQSKLEACAKDEGKVTFYSSLIVNQALKPIAAAFHAKYPYVEVGYVRETGGGMMQKLMTEARAGRPVASLIEATGIDSLARDASLTIPFKTPLADPYPAEYKGADWIASRLSYFGPSYNTDLVKPQDIPKSWTNLADPKWNGKLVWSSESTGAPLIITALRKALGDDNAMEFFKALAKNNVSSVSVNQRQVVNMVMAGEYAISLDAFLHHPIISAREGAPVAPLPLAPIIATNGSVLFPKNGPQPCSGMLLLDFILSTPGQEIMRDAEYFPALPSVAPLPILNPVLPKRANITELFLNASLIAAEQQRSLDIYQQLFR
jgi:ABC-type Fe3+ transport system substrate-binding protein